MAGDSSDKVKKKIRDAKSGAVDAIEAMKKDSSGGSGYKDKDKKSFIFTLLSFFEDIVKKGGDILLAFAEIGLISKKTLKDIRQKMMKSFVFLVLVLFGAVLMIRGIVTYIEFVFPQLANGLGFVFVGLIILSVAYLYHK